MAGERNVGADVARISGLIGDFLTAKADHKAAEVTFQAARQALKDANERITTTKTALMREIDAEAGHAAV